MLAPLRTAIASHIIEGIRRSSVCRLSRCPMNDFLDTETHTGFLRADRLSKRDRTAMSRAYHGMSVIFVKNWFLPSCLKKPIDGSIITSLMLNFLAMKMLSFNAASVPASLPVVRVLLYAPAITGTPALATTSAILLSYFKPDTSFIASAPAATASSATAERGVSTEMGRSQVFFTALIARFILLVSSSTGIIVSR